MKQPIKIIIHKLYKRYVRGLIRREIARQRFKLILWDIFGYLPLVFYNNLRISQRIKLIRRLIIVDYNVVHAHKPCEIVPVILSILDGRGKKGVVIEAGCWHGGSSAKLSLACELAECKFLIFDSFEGVEFGDPNSDQKHFYGQYNSTEAVVKANISKFGCLAVCEFKKGWFKDSFLNFSMNVRVVYIDCDLVKGTFEVLNGIVRNLSKDSEVFTQDYHILPIRAALSNEEMWRSIAISKVPEIKEIARNPARIVVNS